MTSFTLTCNAVAGEGVVDIRRGTLADAADAVGAHVPAVFLDRATGLLPIWTRHRVTGNQCEMLVIK